MVTKNEKISESLKKHFAANGSHNTGKAGWIQSEEQKKNLSHKQIEYWDKRGRKTDEQKRAANKANVYAYRARLYNAVPADSDLKLIKSIYENCPPGYHVDHKQAIAAGGLHHQNNLQYLPIAENCRKGKDKAYDESLAIKWQDIIP